VAVTADVAAAVQEAQEVVQMQEQVEYFMKYLPQI